jgi:hypothetical protein
MLFTWLIVAQFVVVAAHDWIEIPGLVSGRQVQAIIGRRRLAVATVINSLFPAVAVLFAVRFAHEPPPGYAQQYWLVYTAITVVSAFSMWWIPYLFGPSQDHRNLYGKLYRGTWFVLPERGGDRGPNLVHLVFHALFVSTFVLALVQYLGSR